MDFKKYADETMDFVKLIEADGARFPGTDEEKAACKKIQQEIVNRSGLTPKTEEFVYAPNASIGIINKLGWVALIATVCYYIGLGGAFLALFGYVGILVFTFTQIVRYTGMWDFCFKQEKASNIITELPAKGEEKYTVYLGAHYDSSWCWKLALKNPITALIKTGYGILGVVVMLIFSIIKISLGFDTNLDYDAYRALNIVCYVIPIAFIPGFFFVTQYVSHDKTIGSPGAMDNLSGIGINMMLMKHFKENPEDMPEGMKLVNVGFASEEAGLKGSKAFVAAHKNDGALKNAYCINVDSVADPDHFEAVRGDPWQGTKFDQNLINLTLDSMRESGIANPKTIVNPVGGCDSTPFCQAGVPALTIAAQNPTSTDYYHTCRDTSDRIDVSTFETGLKVIYTLIKKIDAQRRGALTAPVAAPVSAPVATPEAAPVAAPEVAEVAAAEVAAPAEDNVAE